MNVYAGIPMGAKSSFNYPWGGTSSLKTVFSWLEQSASCVPLVPSGAEAEPRSPQALPVAAGERCWRRPQHQHCFPQACSWWVFMQNMDTGWPRAPPGTAMGWKGSLLRGQGKGKERKLFLHFVSDWERLQE